MLPYLKNEHEDMLEDHYIAWDHVRRHYKRVRISNEPIQIIKTPKWGYDIIATKKINHQQLRYIEKNIYQIIGKTHGKCEVTLSVFSPQKKKTPYPKGKRGAKGNRLEGRD